MMGKRKGLAGGRAAVLRRGTRNERFSLVTLRKEAGALLAAVMLQMFCLAVSLDAAPLPLEIVIEGVTGEVRKNVEQIVTPPPALAGEGELDQLWLERFCRQAAQKARLALEPFGYYRAQVTVTTEMTTGGGYRLHVVVSPGEPVRVAAVSVRIEGPGAAEKSLQRLAAAFPLKKGDILLQQIYEQAKGAMLARAEELGYREATFPVHQITIDPSLTSARIELVLATGAQHRFDGVTITGAASYPEAFVRRYLAFKSGEVFSPAKLTETQRNLRSSERFRDITVVPGKVEGSETDVPVLIKLTPAPRRSLRTGIGYETDTGARAGLRYRDLNVFERGHEYTALFTLSQRLQGVSSLYSIPDTHDIRNSTTLELNFQREDVNPYDSRLFTAELTRDHSFGEVLLGSAFLRLLHEEYSVGQRDSQGTLALPGVRLTGSRFDDPVRPSRGFRYSLQVRGAPSLFGSAAGLLQATAEGSFLAPLPQRLKLHTRAAAGASLLRNSLHELPPSLRFFAGGDQSVRGYAYKSLGPKDAHGDVVGGRHLLVGSVELERELWRDWGVSVFYDAGNAFDSFSDVRLHQGAGAGVHYYTPVGALNLSLARQIGEDHPSLRIHFSVGFQL